MNFDKTVSIVIPVYNGEKYIEQTLIYILNSSYKKLEIIIVDDGSTDRSLRICKRMKENDSRIFIYTKENGGVASARNYGADRANGDYLCFCDQDDIVEKETYERLVYNIEQEQSDISMCSTGRCIDGKKSELEVSENTCYEHNGILEYLLYPLVFSGFEIPIQMSEIKRYPNIWNCMFRMEFWKKYRFKFRTYINYEDDFLVKIDALTKAEKVSTLSYVGYYWRVNLKSETYAHNYVDDMAKKQQLCYQDMYKCFRERVSTPDILEMFRKVTLCRQYLDAIHNLTSPHQKKTYFFIREYYQQTIYSREFEECISIIKYLKRGYVKPRILLKLLKRHLTFASYFMEITLDYIWIMTLHSQKLAKLERWMKSSKIRGLKGI